MRYLTESKSQLIFSYIEGDESAEKRAKGGYSHFFERDSAWSANTRCGSRVQFELITRDLCSFEIKFINLAASVRNFVAA